MSRLEDILHERKLLIDDINALYSDRVKITNHHIYKLRIENGEFAKYVPSKVVYEAMEQDINDQLLKLKKELDALDSKIVIKD